jgi:hypothetical protein
MSQIPQSMVKTSEVKGEEMAKHDFTELFARYPSIIQQMPDTFTSHQFILELARREQKLYVEALYDYRDKRRSGKRAPFLIVHGILAQQLSAHPDLIRKERTVNSKDIFRQPNTSVKWKKV